MTIVSTLLASEGFRTYLYESNLLEFYQKLSFFSNSTLPPNFVLQPANTEMEEEGNEVDSNGRDRFNSVAQLNPLVDSIHERITKNMEVFCHFDIALMSLTFLETMIFSIVDFHLRVRGERELLDVNNIKTRDLALVQAEDVVRVCSLKEILNGLADGALKVLEKEVSGKKKGAAELGAGVRTLVRMAVVYGKDPVSTLGEIVEVGICEKKENIYKNIFYYYSYYSNYPYYP